MTIQIIGIPSSVGALERGTEQGPAIYRKAEIVEQLKKYHKLVDLGDIPIDNETNRHNNGAIRNWPKPLEMWHHIIKQKKLFDEAKFTLVLGGGCSIVTGAFLNFYNQYGEFAEILSVDHHIDMKIPSPKICMGATAYTLYFLTHENPWIKKPESFHKGKITAMGFDPSTLDDTYEIKGVNQYDKYRVEGHPDQVAREYLASLAPDARVLLHLDLDVICASELSNVYMPSPKGLKMKTIINMLSIICRDPRIVGMVLTEFAPRTDQAQEDARKIVQMLVQILQGKSYQ